MSQYQYIARSADGREVNGIMQADSEAAVIRSLSDRSLFPVEVKPGASRGASGGGRRVRQRDVGVVYSQLADLLDAGVPMMRALETLGRAVTGARLREAIQTVRNDISEGESFADALAAHPDVFRPLHTAMIRAGQRGGFLEDVLRNLAAFLDRQDELASKVRGSLIYPALLTLLGVAAVLVILIALVPRFKPMFAGATLPLPTRILFGLSDGLIGQWPAVLLVLAAAVGGIVAGLRSESGKRWWARARRRVPVFGRALDMVGLTRFCRIFGTLLANGVPMLQALSIAREAAGNPVLADSIDEAAESVRAGESLSQPLAASRVFPPEILEMITVAEESNQLEKVLLQIADTVERRTNRQIDTAVRLIEPLVLVMIAAAIGFMAVGLMYPIFTMAQTLQK